MGSKTITCPVCSKSGYLIKEKPRPKKSSWRRKTYETLVRKPHPIFEVVHNIKKDGKWKTKRCYLGTYQRVLDNMRGYKVLGAQDWDTRIIDFFKMFGELHNTIGFGSALGGVEDRQKIANVLFHYGTHKFSLLHNSKIKAKIDPSERYIFKV